MAEIVFYYYEDYAAAYENGNLLFAGSDSSVKEGLLDYLGVKWEYNNSFMLGTHGSSIAKNLDELNKYENEKRDRLSRAEELERQAKAMILEAEELRGK